MAAGDAGGAAGPRDLAGASADEAARIAQLLRSDQALCRLVAASVDPPTAARWALAFSEAARLGAAEWAGPKSRRGSRASGALAPGQLRQLTVRTAVPFIGFGFFDNTIMLTVGETIDLTFGVAFGFSTLAAAGMGQMVSDASGITLQGLIERFADRLGLPDPCLTLAQQQRSFVKSWMMGSRIVGIVFGCFLGMFPLLLMPDKTPRLVDQIAETMSSQRRHEFSKMVETLHFEQGEKLLEFGETSERVFMVQSGQVEVIGRDVDGLPFMVCTIGPGHAFGIPSLHAPSHVDLIAQEGGVTAQAIGKDDFLRVTGKEALEVYDNARSTEMTVYLRSQGRGLSGGVPRAEKGTGKTRLFASLSDPDKLEVLACTGLPVERRFSGVSHEGKVGFFANLTEEQKRDALSRWYTIREERRRAQEAGEDSVSA